MGRARRPWGRETGVSGNLGLPRRKRQVVKEEGVCSSGRGVCVGV